MRKLYDKKFCENSLNVPCSFNVQQRTLHKKTFTYYIYVHFKLHKIIQIKSKSNSQIQFPNPVPKSSSQIQFTNPVPKSNSQIRLLIPFGDTITQVNKIECSKCIKIAIILLILTNHLFFLFSYLG